MDMSMTLTNPKSTLTLLEQYLAAPLRSLWDQINAGQVYTGGVETWQVHVGLNCRSCDDKTTATFRVATWAEFRQSLIRQAFKCQCGGVLTDGLAIVKVPILRGLTKRS